MIPKQEQCPQCQGDEQTLLMCSNCAGTGKVDAIEEEMPSDRREEKEFDGAYADDDLNDE